MSTGFVYDDMYLEHDTGEFHPECPERLTAIKELLQKEKWFGSLTHIKPEDADPDSISLVHPEDYIDQVRHDCEKGYSVLTTGDTSICPASYEVALRTVGGVLKAVDSILSGETKNVFCAVRPPGHHATPVVGMGFCLFNSVAVAVRYAQQKYGIDRVLIADWDVHHGNGTQEIFYEDGSVLFMSTHQSPFYPGTGKIYETGAGKGEGLTINRPLPAGSGNKELIEVFKNDFLQKAREFRPEFTIVSAGFDSRFEDILGGFLVNDDGFKELTQIMMEISGINGNGKLLSVLEGGYNVHGSALAVKAHMEELIKA
jgi:acetoin utilization deacetylase AcuC-like enzyme